MRWRSHQIQRPRSRSSPSRSLNLSDLLLPPAHFHPTRSISSPYSLDLFSLSFLSLNLLSLSLLSLDLLSLSLPSLNLPSLSLLSLNLLSLNPLGFLPKEGPGWSLHGTG